RWTCRAERATALGNRPVKQAARLGGGAEHADGDAAGGFSKDRHAIGITSERGDVALNPLQSRDLVEEAVVSRSPVRGLRTELGMREKAERADAVVDRDQHDPLAREMLAVVHGS